MVLTDCRVSCCWSWWWSGLSERLYWVRPEDETELERYIKGLKKSIEGLRQVVAHGEADGPTKVRHTHTTHSLTQPLCRC